MQIVIEPQHLLHVHNDANLAEWLTSIPRRPGDFKTAARFMADVSGRALRSLLLNAPSVEGALATPTFEALARQYTPTMLYSVYHALVRDDATCWNELRRDAIAQPALFRHAKVSVESVLALTYILVSVTEHWTMSRDEEEAVSFLLGKCAESLDRSMTVHAGLEASIDPLRVVYVRSFTDGTRPDETVGIVDAKVYSNYLAHGYTDAQLTGRIAEAACQATFVRQI